MGEPVDWIPRWGKYIRPTWTWDYSKIPRSWTVFICACFWVTVLSWYTRRDSTTGEWPYSNGTHPTSKLRPLSRTVRTWQSFNCIPVGEYSLCLVVISTLATPQLSIVSLRPSASAPAGLIYWWTKILMWIWWHQRGTREDIADEIATSGLEEISAHFLPWRK